MLRDSLLTFLGSGFNNTYEYNDDSLKAEKPEDIFLNIY